MSVVAAAEAGPNLSAQDGSEASPLQGWIAVGVGGIAGFMAILDLSIVNASLPVIQGEIGATASEATWIGTAYLTAEIVTIPLVSWLDRLIGMRRLFMTGVIVFTIFSMMCGLASSLTEMVIGRLGQGLSGGVLMPLAYSMIPRMLPPSQQTKAIAFVSTPILTAPIFGPLIGGWLTEAYSWHYAFFINLPVGLLLIPLMLAVVPASKGDWSEFRDADWAGVAGMGMGLGGLTLMLEEGYREQWFESALIRNLALVSLAGFGLIALGQWRARRPVLKLSLILDRTIASALGITAVAGGVMFANLFLLPQFLVTIRGYNAWQAGQVIIASGVASTMAMLAFPLAVKHVDVRLLVMSAIIILAFSFYMQTVLTAETPGRFFILTQVLWSIGTSFSIMPMQNLTMAAVAAKDIPEINCLTTVVRNLGGSIFLAGLASFQAQRLEFHHWRLHETLGANDPAVGGYLDGAANMLGGGNEAAAAALNMLDQVILREALVMTFNDAFLVMTVATLLILVFPPFLRTSALGDAPMAGGH